MGLIRRLSDKLSSTETNERSLATRFEAGTLSVVSASCRRESSGEVNGSRSTRCSKRGQQVEIVRCRVDSTQRFADLAAPEEPRSPPE